MESIIGIVTIPSNIQRYIPMNDTLAIQSHAVVASKFRVLEEVCITWIIKRLGMDPAQIVQVAPHNQYISPANCDSWE